MRVRHDDRPMNGTLRPLSRQEIDDRIRRLVIDLIEPGGDETPADDSNLVPRWISAEELVRRMSRHISPN